MPLTDLTLRRIIIIIPPNPTRFDHQKLPSLNTISATLKKNLTMAGEASEKKTTTRGNENKAAEKKKEKSTPPPPPPPEKPLPDDCCGSGCVRCVWDVYYDELEAYDKLYGNSNSSESSANNSNKT